MPLETSRKTHMVRITDPNDPHRYVDVKVIDEITFTDQHDQVQDFRYRVDNTSGNTFRKTHTQTVTGEEDPNSKLDVERIDEWNAFTSQERQQETGYRMPGNQQEPPAHYKTHVFRITSAADPNVYVDVQRIDEAWFLDPHDSAQDTVFILNNPDDDMSNPSDVDMSSDGTAINPPWRLDPFQNIINVHWAGGHGMPAPPPPSGGHGHVPIHGQRYYLATVNSVGFSNEPPPANASEILPKFGETGIYQGYVAPGGSSVTVTISGWPIMPGYPDSLTIDAGPSFFYYTPPPWIYNSVSCLIRSYGVLDDPGADNNPTGIDHSNDFTVTVTCSGG